MPITVEWGNAEKTFVFLRYVGRWEVKDLHQALDQIFDMFGTVPHMVDTLVDMTESKSSPTNLLAAAGRVERRAKNAGQTVIVSANSYLKAIADVARFVAPKTVGQTHFCTNLEDAYRILGVSPKSQVVE